MKIPQPDRSRHETFPWELKRHVLLTAEALAELQELEDPTWVPVCENEHTPPSYAEFLNEGGSLLCSACTFCRECGHELVGRECPISTCILFAKDARGVKP